MTLHVRRTHELRGCVGTVDPHRGLGDDVANNARAAAYRDLDAPEGWEGRLLVTLLKFSTFTADQIRFVNLIVNELTANGVVEPARLYESPYIDHAPTGPDTVFPEADVDNIVKILNTVKTNAAPADGAA